MIDGIVGPVGNSPNSTPYSPAAEPSDQEEAEFSTQMNDEGSGVPSSTGGESPPKDVITEEDIQKGIESQIMTSVMDESKRNRERLQKILDKLAPM